MFTVSFVLILAYLLFTWISLQLASSPIHQCRPTNERCFRPIIAPGDSLTFQLYLLHPRNGTSPARWMPEESCRLTLTVPDPRNVWFGTSAAWQKDSSSSQNCTVAIPEGARLRTASQRTTRPLQGVFRLEAKNASIVVAEIPIDLTRVVERKPKGWKSLVLGSSASKSRRNLLEDPLMKKSSAYSIDEDGPLWIPYLKYGQAPVRIRLVNEYRGYGVLGRNDGIRLDAFNSTHYRPIAYVDDNSLPYSAQIELAPPEDNKPPVHVAVKVSFVSPTMDAIIRQMTEALKMAETVIGQEEIDEIRYFVQDEKLYRFICTQIISYVHIWLDYMAFRDEVRFYRGKQSLKGVSASSVISRFVCSVIIFLYLLDGGGTSWVVLLSLASSCAVEGWKVWKLFSPELVLGWPFVKLRPLATSEEKEIASYDRIAAKNLGLVLYPLVVGWSIYALRHYEYRSWWSWLISNLANAVYTFGFISLCPQLYVNYRLKSVAHLPWKVFVYKIFITFVDDAFAWLVDMPWKHRIMTLRDDVVFVMLLVQVYMYRVDKTRTNEFGYSYEHEVVGAHPKISASDTKRDDTMEANSKEKTE